MNNPRRKICVVTGSRAEYGLLYWLLKEIDSDPDLELQLVVTGMHLSHEFGYSVERIKSDGFTVADQIEILLSSDTHVGMAKSTGLGVISFADSFRRLSPDIIVLFGDRFEIFSAAITANMMNIPIAHVHGGELSAGSIDDSMRHAITKLAHVHFPIADEYKRRILQMGEAEKNVFNCGAPGLDYLDHCQFKTRQELVAELGITFSEKNNFLITLHASTRDTRSPEKNIDQLISALANFPEATLFFTQANCDAGGEAINNYLREYCSKNKNAYVFKELGIENYLSLAKQVDVIIGNSSSGLIEVPCLRKPTVNIGSRQLGRIKVTSVVDVELNEQEITQAIKLALSRDFQENISAMTIPFKQDKTSYRIKEILKKIALTGLCSKHFVDSVPITDAVMA